MTERVRRLARLGAMLALCVPPPVAAIGLLADAPAVVRPFQSLAVASRPACGAADSGVGASESVVRYSYVYRAISRPNAVDRPSGDTPPVAVRATTLDAGLLGGRAGSP